MIPKLVRLSTMLVAFAAAVAPTLAAEDRPNILFAIADDWGWPHAGVYGDPVVQTPTFDRVAREGVRFEHAYVSSPSCTPSRSAILTGQWHWRLEESANLWSTLRKDYPVYPDLLEEAGYVVGFERKGWGPGRVEVGGRTRNAAGPRFESFEEFLAQRPDGRPFCYWFGSYDPHRDYEAGSGARSGMKLDEIRLFPHFPDSPEVRGDVADYYWEVQRFDGEVGAILALLEKRGELDRTIVVMTGDNGIPFPRCKANLYDCGVRVPLAVGGPGVAGGRVVEAFVSLADLAPTFLELGGVEPPAVMTGRSLLPLLGAEGPDPKEVAAREHVLAGKERHVPAQERPDTGGTPMRSIRTHEFLYIRNFRPDRWPAGTPHYQRATLEGAWLGDCDNGPTKFYMVEHQDDDAEHRRLYDLSFAKRPAEELYDLRKDPGQLRNVAAVPEYAETRKALEARLMEELRATGDPRVVGGADHLEAYPYYGHGPRWPGLEKAP
ncbi:MAG: sulfatase [Acidobacteria bacterium]|nr:sulfatase [Acidobacteriota bacterium]